MSKDSSYLVIKSKLQRHTALKHAIVQSILTFSLFNIVLTNKPNSNLKSKSKKSVTLQIKTDAIRKRVKQE